MYAAGGKLMDVLGTRAGLLLIMLFWSLACASHGLATSLGMLVAVSRCCSTGKAAAFGGNPRRRRVVSRRTSDRPRWASSTPGPPSAA